VPDEHGRRSPSTLKKNKGGSFPKWGTRQEGREVRGAAHRRPRAKHEEFSGSTSGVLKRKKGKGGAYIFLGERKGKKIGGAECQGWGSQQRIRMKG